MGERPDWYSDWLDLKRAGDFYHCAPWELIKQPHFWIEAAFAHEVAEAHARNPTGG